jgi:Xaa-Pro aminopeptidase
MFAARIYEERRSRLKAQFSSGLLLFLGNDESPMNYADNTYPFRQDSSFLYYFGVDLPGCAALIDLDQDRTTLFADDLTLDDIVWTGLQPTVAEIALAGGVRDTAGSAELAVSLGRRGARQVHFLPPYRPEHQLKLFRLLGLHPDQQAGQASVPLLRAVAEQRAVKAPEEIAEIERAVDVSVDMHLAAMRMARPGVREAEIAARVTGIALASGGALAYPVIATVHGETLHNHHYGNVLEDGQVFLLDAGAESPGHYAGDLTSTCPVGAGFTPRQRDIYQVVLTTHLAALEQLKPGVPFRDVHLAACRTLASGLKDLKLMKGNLDDAVALGAHAMFLPCGLGHMMGMDVHDMENLGEVWVGYEGNPKSTLFGLKSLRLARPLRAGFVLTVEPGIYFIPELIQRWGGEGRFRDYLNYDLLESYRGENGFRVEENVLVTPGGHRILGKPRPRTIGEILEARA